jgi:hypothetical protein
MTAAFASGPFGGAAGAFVLESEVPAVAPAPAPWKLTGSGYVFMIRLPRTMTDAELFTPPALRDKRVGNVATLMVVDYATSGVGPYRELLVTPGVFQGEHGRFHSVTRIYVSTYESVVNGRVNWGIPKDVADFSIDEGRDGRTDIVVSRAGRPLAQIRVKAHGFALPIWSGFLPAAGRTFLQPWGGKAYEIAPSARGLARRARILDLRFDPELFPDLSRGRVVAGFHLPRFTMTFPVATLKTL